MARKTNYLHLALDLRRGLWLIDNPDVLMPAVSAFLSRAPIPDAPALDDYTPSSWALLSDGSVSPHRKEDAQKEERVIVVPLHGSMTKYDTCESYGTAGIAEKMLQYLEDDTVVGFVLDIDSGGGAANSVSPLTRAIARIREAGKPVIAHADACLSAAYWVASQCDALFLDNSLSQCGSIGAFAQILDDREDKQTGYRFITVYAPESTDKNLAYREALDGHPEPLEAELSDLVAQFRSAVSSGRPALKADVPGVFSGGKFSPEAAAAAGLADGTLSLDECVQAVFVRAYSK